LIKVFPKSHYRQDETAVSIIVRKMFPHVKFWDEPTIRGFQCDDCAQDLVKRERWTELPDCPGDRIALRLHDLMVLHTVSFAGGVSDLLNVIEQAPDWVMMYDDIMKQQSRLCKVGNITRVFEPLGSREHLLLLAEDLPDPLIDYEWLRDDDHL
jgi:hypothetical protein